jgi:hypothetical protein
VDFGHEQLLGGQRNAVGHADELDDADVLVPIGAGKFIASMPR